MMDPAAAKVLEVTSQAFAEVAAGPHIVVFGSPTDGFTHVGPFADHMSAAEYAEERVRDEAYWIVPLEQP
jgi:hypothetical protein